MPTVAETTLASIASFLIGATFSFLLAYCCLMKKRKNEVRQATELQNTGPPLTYPNTKKYIHYPRRALTRTGTDNPPETQPPIAPAHIARPSSRGRPHDYTPDVPTGVRRSVSPLSTQDQRGGQAEQYYEAPSSRQVV
ncbi:hypothetical protein B0T21DRAFT_409653 [Apiosordaria backusii]|uniref:Uncharacterized protein n=1 Tax=Apiosordaria backusii TaxID=314023 RepID=A0AA40BS08_9PEZI|nr:hypothetical protein B0T21DRAFT_409653 [Apiosordaria backusii]